MITDDHLALITAAVDGELSPSETNRFRRLLDTSVEARGLYVRLKADSARLAALPRVPPPADLPAQVMAKVAAITPTPGSLPIPTLVPKRGTMPTVAPVVAIPFVQPPSTRRSWVPAAVAASLMLAAMGTSFWFFTRAPARAERLARSPDQPPPATQRGAADPEWSKWLPAEHGPRPVTPTPAVPPQTGPQLARTAPASAEPASVAGESATPLAPPPRSSYDPVLGAGLGSEISPLDLVQIHLPFLRSIADLEAPEVRRELAEELGKEPAFRIDVFTRNLPRSVDWMRAAAKASGVSLFVDATTADRVVARQVNSFVVYTESLSPTEVADLFGRLAAEDARISPRIFDQVHAAPIVADDQRAVKTILGIDPGLFKRPKQEKPEKGYYTAKPLSAGTADQIVKSLTAAKGADKSAMLMTWLPGVARTAPAMSSELKQFLTKRGDRKVNAVPVIIVVRYREG